MLLYYYRLLLLSSGGNCCQGKRECHNFKEKNHLCCGSPCGTYAIRVMLLCVIDIHSVQRSRREGVVAGRNKPAFQNRTIISKSYKTIGEISAFLSTNVSVTAHKGQRGPRTQHKTISILSTTVLSIVSVNAGMRLFHFIATQARLIYY